MRICARDFPALHLGCTVDILSHPCLERALGRAALAEAVFQALNRGRMRVFARHLNWVTELIGVERAAICTSLPVSARQSGSRREGPKR
jgi:hypothetical protein